MKPLDVSQLLRQHQSQVPEMNRSAVDRVYEDLHRRIVSLELPPDATLTRAQLCEDYRVSQTPVREALQRLEQAGLVKIYPQSRTVVSRIDVTQLNETQFLREALETEVIRRLSQLQDEDLVARLSALVDMQELLANDTSQLGDFYRLDELFHEQMFSAAGQLGLYWLVQSKSGHMARLRHLDLPSEGKMRDVIDDHRRIVGAIASGVPEQATEAMRHHLEGTLSRYQRLRGAYPEYFAD